MSAVPAEPFRSRAAATVPGFDFLSQIAIITPDAGSTIRTLCSALGVGSFKFVTLTPPALFDATFDGRPIDGSMKVGLTWVGDMQLEVIEPLSKDTVYARYLHQRQNRPGIEHVFLHSHRLGYEQAMGVFEQAGFPPRQHGRMNASGRLGPLTLPPLPALLAPRLATRFCYTCSQAELKLDFELARFAFGVSARLGLRMAAPDEWIPAGEPHHFETLPRDAAVERIDGVYVFGRDLDALVAAYARLADRAPAIVEYEDDLLPGKGRLAAVELGSTAIVLVHPLAGPLSRLMDTHGEGAVMIRARAGGDVRGRLQDRGWSVVAGRPGLHAVHEAVPFALWVTGDAG